MSRRGIQRDVSAEEAGAGLERERARRPMFAAIAVVAGVLILIGALIQTLGHHAKVQEVTLVLLNESGRSGQDVAGAVVLGLGSLALAATLVFVFDAIRLRNPQATPFLRMISLIGGSLAAIASIGYWVEFTHKAHQFASTGQQTYMDAHRVLTGTLVIFQILELVGALLVAIAIVFTSLQAMRVGLLTRFMGYIGMFAGALVLFQITPLPVVETYWLVALGVLLAGRWPTGQPLAWAGTEARPWPSAQAMREQRVRATSTNASARPLRGRAAKLAARAAAQAQAEPPPTPAEAEKPARGSTATRQVGKRKRKRRS